MAISKKEIAAFTLAFAGAATDAVSIPYTYFGAKFKTALSKEAHGPGGIEKRYSYAKCLENSSHAELETCVGKYPKLMAELYCSSEQANYYSAKTERLRVEREFDQYKDDIRKYKGWFDTGSLITFLGLVSLYLGSILSVDYMSKRKRSEGIESEKEEKPNNSCSSLDEKIYCTKMEKIFLDGAKINNYV